MEMSLELIWLLSIGRKDAGAMLFYVVDNFMF